MKNVSQTVPRLYVSNINASRAFYCNQLGFTLLHSWEPENKLTWCRIEFGGAALMLQQDCTEVSPPAERGKGVVFYIICEDALVVFQSLEKAGVPASEPKTEFYGMIQTHLSDPDGDQLCFESPVD